MIVLVALAFLGAQDSQIGARSRAMGGGYTAFEDDPTSLWHNPAGVATQPGGLSLAYQTFTVYEKGGSGDPDLHALPSFAGVVVEIGTEERPQSLGLCLARPVFLNLAFDAEDDIVSPNLWETEQTFYRVRLAYARDFRFRAVGEEGWFPHLAIGLGADAGFTAFEMTDVRTGDSGDDSDSAYGGGAGILLGVYDNTRNVKINVGAAYQSAIEFDLRVIKTLDERAGPTFNWPDQFQVGLLLYLLDGLPLRISIDALMVDWKAASTASDLPGVEDFSRTTTVSVGAEYRLPAGGTTVLFPRLGLRVYDAPWDSDRRARLPASDEWQLSISTRGERFFIVSFGLGVSFALAAGRMAAVDAAFDFGGDSPGVAIGVTAGF